MENWIYVLIVTVFALGYWTGHRRGKLDGQQEMLYQQQRLEATRIWAETMKPKGGTDEHKES